jgi:hypothetical protein
MSRGMRIIRPKVGTTETNKNLIGVTEKFKEYIPNPSPITNKEKMDQAFYELIFPIVDACGENFTRRELQVKSGNFYTPYTDLLELVAKGKERGLLKEIRVVRPKEEKGGKGKG